MIQQCALMLNQEVNLKGGKVKYKFIPSVFYLEHCIFLSEMISEGQVVGILQPTSQKGGAVVLAIGQVEKDGEFIRLYRCEAISGSSRRAEAQWTRDTIMHHANEVSVTFTVTSAVPSLAVQRVGGAEGSLLGTEKCIPGDVFDNDEWISGVGEFNPRLVWSDCTSTQQKVQTTSPWFGEGR